eukprot:Clim_evm26s136 gene=Clim_evmTU26s136
MIFRVGKLEHGVATLLTKEHYVVEWPLALLPEDCRREGSVVEVVLEKDQSLEEKRLEHIIGIQDMILKKDGQLSNHTAVSEETSQVKKDKGKEPVPIETTSVDTNPVETAPVETVAAAAATAAVAEEAVEEVNKESDPEEQEPAQVPEPEVEPESDVEPEPTATTAKPALEPEAEIQTEPNPEPAVYPVPEVVPDLTPDSEPEQEHEQNASPEPEEDAAPEPEPEAPVTDAEVKPEQAVPEAEEEGESVAVVPEELTGPAGGAAPLIVKGNEASEDEGSPIVEEPNKPVKDELLNEEPLLDVEDGGVEVSQSLQVDPAGVPAETGTIESATDGNELTADDILVDDDNKLASDPSLEKDELEEVAPIVTDKVSAQEPSVGQLIDFGGDNDDIADNMTTDAAFPDGTPPSKPPEGFSVDDMI